MSHWRSASGSAFGPLPGWDRDAARLSAFASFLRQRVAAGLLDRVAVDGSPRAGCGNAADDRVLRDAFDARFGSRLRPRTQRRVERTVATPTSAFSLTISPPVAAIASSGGIGRAFVVDDDVLGLALLAGLLVLGRRRGVGAATASARTVASGSKSLRTNSPFGRGSGQAPSPEMRSVPTPKGRKSNLFQVTARPAVPRGNRDNLPGAARVPRPGGSSCRNHRRSRAARLGPLTLRNRIIKAATFEGRTPQPRRHRRPHRVPPPGRGGRRGHDDGRVLRGHARRAAPTDTSSRSTSPRSAPGCASSPTRSTPKARRRPRRLGHAGPVANPAGTKHPSLAPSRVFSPLGMRRTQARHRGRPRRRITRQFADGAARPRRRRLRRDRDPPRPQLSARARSSRRS